MPKETIRFGEERNDIGRRGFCSRGRTVNGVTGMDGVTYYFSHGRAFSGRELYLSGSEILPLRAGNNRVSVDCGNQAGLPC